LIVFTAIPLVAVDSEFMTATFLNGRAWKAFDDSGRTAYIAGLYNALMFANAVCKESEFKSIYLPSAPAGEVVKGLDLFYEDPANGAIPILYAVRIFKMRLEGSSQAEIQAATEDARRSASEVRPREKH
jgi:hypothetical protein